jgi:hypothetical protein
MRIAITCTALALALSSCTSTGPAHEHHAAAASPSNDDARQAVRFPAMLREHTLANMRDHLATLQRLQEALASGRYDEAAELSERRLGMSSLPLHGAHDVAPYMPQPMQQMGTAMHKAASRFALEAQDAAATGDVKPALAALSRLTSQCVACHAAYRLEP